jgi:hypothetical protein
MERREVLVRIGGLLLALPASRVLLACGTDGGGGTLTFTSSNDLDHTHTVAFQLTELSTPPASGVTKQTSRDLGHTHMVALTEAELASIHSGGSVTKTTSEDDGHTHTFTFLKM